MKKIAKILLICLATILMFAACSSPSNGSDKSGGQDEFSFVGTWKSDILTRSGFTGFYVINAYENDYDCFIYEDSTYKLLQGWKGTYSKSGTGSNIIVTAKDEVYYDYTFNSGNWKKVEIPENETFEVLSDTQVVAKGWEEDGVLFTKQTATSSGSAEQSGPFLSVDGYARVEPADNGLNITVNNRYNWGNLGVYVRNVDSDYPRESQIYQVLDFKSSGDDNYNKTENILFPFVKSGNKYEVVVFMQDNNWSGWIESKPVLVKATGGKGEVYAKMTSGSYNPSEKKFSWEIETCENISTLLNDTFYKSSINVGVYSYTDESNVWENYEGVKIFYNLETRNFVLEHPFENPKTNNIFLDIYYEICKENISKYNIKLDPNQKYTTFSMK